MSLPKAQPLCALLLTAIVLVSITALSDDAGRLAPDAAVHRSTKAACSPSACRSAQSSSSVSWLDRLVSLRANGEFDRINEELIREASK